VLSCALLLLSAAPAQSELSEANLAALRKEIVPTEAELKWRAIPWRVTLWAGAREGQRLDRPVLLYAMNGHPCGAT
jgi:hypothetical protein